jgi:phospho-N-acetylmuramoyl-pentapeptide-transferase
MIYFLGQFLHPRFEPLSFLRLVEYLSARSIAAALTAILLIIIIMPRFIWYLHRRSFVDQMRDTGIPSASEKAGTPVMGGAVVVGCVFVSCLLWCNLANRYLLMVLAGMLWFGTIGFMDDLKKMKAKSGDRGLSEIMKLLLQMLFAAGLLLILASPLSPLPTNQAGTFYIPMALLAHCVLLHNDSGQFGEHFRWA